MLNRYSTVVLEDRVVDPDELEAAEEQAEQADPEDRRCRSGSSRAGAASPTAATGSCCGSAAIGACRKARAVWLGRDRGQGDGGGSGIARLMVRPAVGTRRRAAARSGADGGRRPARRRSASGRGPRAGRGLHPPAELGRACPGEHPAVVDDPDRVGQLLGDREQVGRHQHGDPGPRLRDEQVLDDPGAAGSSPTSGSSTTRTFGSCTRAEAKTTRCFIPCE